MRIWRDSSLAPAIMNPKQPAVTPSLSGFSRVTLAIFTHYIHFVLRTAFYGAWFVFVLLIRGTSLVSKMDVKTSALESL